MNIQQSGTSGRLSPDLEAMLGSCPTWWFRMLHAAHSTGNKHAERRAHERLRELGVTVIFHPKSSRRKNIPEESDASWWEYACGPD